MVVNMPPSLTRIEISFAELKWLLQMFSRGTIRQGLKAFVKDVQSNHVPKEGESIEDCMLEIWDGGVDFLRDGEGFFLRRAPEEKELN